MARLDQSETELMDSVSSNVLGGAKLVSPVTDITLTVPYDTPVARTRYSGTDPRPARVAYDYRITLEEAEQIFFALRDSIAQAKIVKTLIEDNVI